MAERCLLLFPGKETSERVNAIVKHLLAGWEGVEETGVDMTWTLDGVDHPVHFDIQSKCCQVDGKNKKVMTGATGAFCQCCTCTAAEARDPERVALGFFINRTIEEMTKIWEKLVTVNKKGEEVIKKRPNDYATRAGQCHRPMVEPGQMDDLIATHPPMHFRMNTLDWCEEVILRLREAC